MKISNIRIKNFRKLDDCKISISKEKTVFVGANNSGKTSAMYCLKAFLGSDEKSFKTTDFPLSKIASVNEFSNTWSIGEIEKFCPTLELTLNDIQDIDLPKIKHLIPSLNWSNEPITVRLVYEPNDIDIFKQIFIEYIETIRKLQGENNELPLPDTLFGFLEIDNNLNKFFCIKAYLIDSNTEELNPKKLKKNPFKGVFKVSVVPAQRGFDDSDNPSSVSTSLSKHLGDYYDNHINPKRMPTDTDIDVLNQVDKLQVNFSSQLNKDFEPLINELRQLGYPSSHGDPVIKLKSEIDTSSIIKQNTTLVFNTNNDVQNGLDLPEKHNGLGYRNLIFIFFQLLKFRDEWLRKAKAKNIDDDKNVIEPIHLVLIEEPEAHLHSQAQQIFIRNSYEILTSGIPDDFNTHLIISTHSSYIAHEAGFDSLTYFKRKKTDDNYPCSETVGLATVFSPNDDSQKTKEFVSRYLRVMHCDLFFADAVIMVEGSAERMLIPHFILNKYEQLTSSYLSILEVGGAYAHKFKPLIEALDLPTLVITDLDSKCPNDNKKVRPIRGCGQISNCDELTKWLTISNRDLDTVLDLEASEKIKGNTRIAYQIETDIKDEEGDIIKAIPYTFEDALVLTNFEFFKSEEPKIFKGMLEKMRKATHATTIDEACQDMFDALSGTKAVMALDILYDIDIDKLEVPNYIDEGLNWLTDKLNSVSYGDITNEQ